MRTERSSRGAWGAAALLSLSLLLGAVAAAAESGAAAGEEPAKAGADWQHWQANSDVTDLASVQRGARNFTSYCLGCHSLKYERWSRLGQDLADPRNTAAARAHPAR